MAVLREPPEWNDPLRAVQSPRTLSEDDVRTLMEEASDKYSRKITDKFVESQTRLINQKTRQAYEAWKS